MTRIDPRREVSIDLRAAPGPYSVAQDGRVVARAISVALVAVRFAPHDRLVGRWSQARSRPASAERVLRLPRGGYAVGDRVITCADRAYLGPSGIWVVGAG